jgi:DNA ligase-associated metallophosphoesterase
VQIKLQNNHFELLPQRAIYWQEEESLILSDLHIGKGMHFRKEGIPIPNSVFDDDLQKLSHLIQRFSPQSLIIVGDMFHSHHNVEVNLFDLWRVQYPGLNIHLVKGNHDILSTFQWSELNILIHDTLETNDFIFSHARCYKEKRFCFSGHIHPGVRINGTARQTLKLPCFHFTPKSCTLPAFGKFTGLYLIKPQRMDQVFVILEDKVVSMS